MNVPFLTLLMLIPFLGALFIFFMRDPHSNINAPRVMRLVTLAHFVYTIFLLTQFDPLIQGFQYVEKHIWLPSFDSAYHLGIDALSLALISLTSFLMMLIGWHHIPMPRIREYYSCFLLLHALLMGIFCAQDLILFYVFFEASLLPMFFIIGIWGGQERLYATFKFFLYTFLGSVFMLIAFVTLALFARTTNIESLYHVVLPFSMERFIWLGFFFSFAIKIPMWPFHTWLPHAHVEAPTKGSMILAGILLKLGGYGFLRLSLPILPEASYFFAPLVIVLSLIAIVYTSLVALAQKDMKKLIAYSSIAHMGIVTLGLFTFSPLGISGGILQMLSHGFVSAALFFCIGVVYDRFHTREIAHYGGLVNEMPRYAVFFLIFTLASIGLPGTSGFVGEFSVLIASFALSPTITVIATLGLILGAAYSLWLYRRIVFDKLSPHLDKKHALDLLRSEGIVLLFLAIPVFCIGLYSSPLTRFLSPYTHHLCQHLEKRLVHKHSLWTGLSLSMTQASKHSRHSPDHKTS